jgi:single-strand DNA-binding protein
MLIGEKKKMNSVAFAGNLGKDPKMTVTDNGTVITKFSLAVRKRNSDTLWLNIVTFGKTAELCDKWLSSGSKVALSGILDINEWEDKDGKQRRSPEVIANHVTFQDPKESPKTEQPPVTPPDDDIPF